MVPVKGSTITFEHTSVTIDVCCGKCVSVDVPWYLMQIYSKEEGKFLINTLKKLAYHRNSVNSQPLTLGFPQVETPTPTKASAPSIVTMDTTSKRSNIIAIESRKKTKRTPRFRRFNPEGQMTALRLHHNDSYSTPQLGTIGTLFHSGADRLRP